MRRLTAILLMGLLFFDWYGYRLLIAYWQYNADRTLTRRLDQGNYDERQLVLVKVPVYSLSYYNSSERFERVDGELVVDGLTYRYVKRRLFKDTLELLCLPHLAATQLKALERDFTRGLAGAGGSLPDQSPSKSPGKRPGPAQELLAFVEGGYVPLMGMRKLGRPVAVDDTAGLAKGFPADNIKPPSRHFVS